jgi:RHS repeat-associated protein
MRAIRAAVFLMALVGVLSPLCLPQAVTGVQPFNSYGGGPFDTVNLGNLNVHFSIPIFHKAGRGIPFAYDLTHESTIWTPVTSGSTKVWQPAQNWGWSTPWAGTTGYVTYLTTTSYCYGSNGFPDDAIATTSNWQYVDRGGVVHHFTGGQIFFGDHVPACTGTSVNSFTSQATDGSGLTLNVPNSADTAGNLYVQDPSGNFFYPPVNPTNNTQQQATQGPDHNGNKITLNSSNGQITDTLGQLALTITGTNPVLYTYPTPGGSGSAPIKLNYATYNVKTNFGCSGVSEYTATNVSLVSSIALPDGTSYSFGYEPTPGFSGYYTGRIKSLTLPTGGTILYGYTGSNNGIICADGSTAGLTRTLTPGGQWTYTRTDISGKHWQTKVTTPSDPQNGGTPPAGNDTIIDLQNDATTTNPTHSFYETNRVAYQGTQAGNNILLTTTTCWNFNTANCTTTAVSSPISQKVVTLQYPGGGLQSKSLIQYSGSLITETDQYSYGSGAPGGLVRKTTIQYGSWNGGSCSVLGNNISNMPCQVTIIDGGTPANTLSQTRYTYDESAVQATTGTPQHDAVSSSRGNLTTASTLVSGSTYLAKHFSYYDTGNVYQATDLNGAITTYNYPDTTSTCGNGFPTTVTLPISGLSSLASTTWSCVGGVATQANDLNGNAAIISYSDPFFWRPASAQDPAGAITTFTYNPYNSGTQTLASVDGRMLFNGNSSVVEQLTTVNQFGKSIYSQQREGPSSASWDSTQVLYDNFLRPYQSTMPCVTSSGTGCSGAATTTSTFDALGRVLQTTDGGGGFVRNTYTQNDVLVEVGPAPSGENTKQKQMEYDALGRLTSVCEKTNLTGYGVCSQQTSSPNGYFTQYAFSVVSGSPTTTVTQNAQGSPIQTRVYTYDLLGRLISEQNPENGTTTYTYDSDSAGTCSGTYNGDLIKLVDAKGNTVCYQYDALHRIAQITYPSSGPDAANTPAKTYVYDSATFNGTSMSNPKGRLVEAYTVLSGTKKSDEFFSYSSRGELTDTWECTPHSGTNGCASVSNYYQVTAAFWENGALKTLSSSISAIPTQSYGVDGMGRTASVSASSGQNPVTSTSYNLSTFSIGVTLGSGDSDTFYLDPNTGRQTKYVFNINGSSDTGQTNWNPNGSLGNFQITDNIPGTSDTQTCSYVHDDLARISSVNCVNGTTNKWNQAFTYDAFGNITKTSSGPGISFQPNYDHSKNWITSLPGPITTNTDANGQVTYDGVHNYTWDAEGKMFSVDTTTLVHDALGRMVEKAVGTTYTQIVYGPAGNKFATMNGQTLLKAFIPLPSGGKAVYTSSGLAYYRHPDHLGSSRLATTPSRTLYSSTAYAPYGEPYTQAGTTDLSFTGQDQDTVSGIHDFLLREFMPVPGRWLSPDPAGLGAVDSSNPQSWNRYAYVLNNPMAMIDMLGDDGCYTYWVIDAGCAGPGDGGWGHEGGPSGGAGSALGQSNGPGDNAAAEAGYAAFVDAIFMAGGSVIYWANGNGVYINWNVEGGVYGINLASGETVDISAVLGDLSSASSTTDGVASGGDGPGNYSPWEMRGGVVAIIKGNNDCSAWFNTGKGKALDIISNVSIENGNASPGPRAYADAGTPEGPLGPITVFPDGRFYANSKSAIPVGAVCNYAVGASSCSGGYQPGSYGARMIILLHELAHKVYLIDPDGFLDTTKSDANTQTVMKHCASTVGPQTQ